MARWHIFGKRKQSGYTLIELLLVVTVIAVIAALGVKMYRDKAQTDRINIAALSMQHVLESAMAYNVANGLWPEKNWSSDGHCSAPADTDFVDNYLPNESNQSNYGTYFCWSGDDATQGSQKAPRFWVAFAISSGANATDTAKRIASRLPNAIITLNPDQETGTPSNTCSSDGSAGACYVKAEVSVPSATSNDQNKLTLAGAGNCNPSIPHGQVQLGAGSDVSCERTTMGDQYGSQAGAYADNDSLSQYEIKFSCKTNEEGSLYVTPNYLKLDRDKDAPSDPLYQLSVGTTDCVVDESTGLQTCTVTMAASSGATGQSPAEVVGCTAAYQQAGICSCSYRANGVCGSNTTPGAIGASYTAVCVPKTAASLVSGSVLY